MDWRLRWPSFEKEKAGFFSGSAAGVAAGVKAMRFFTVGGSFSGVPCCARRFPARSEKMPADGDWGGPPVFAMVGSPAVSPRRETATAPRSEAALAESTREPPLSAGRLDPCCQPT